MHALPIQWHFSLRQLNTFGIDAKTHAYLRVDCVDILRALQYNKQLSSLPKFILGGGSNVLLTQDFPGLILHIRNTGMAVIDVSHDKFYVKASAGENWHHFVQWTLKQDIGGLENLSLIPGSVGAAPIQNIGAYGVECQDYLHSLTAFDLSTGTVLTLVKQDCGFAYRDSIFKHDWRNRFVILDVSFALPRQWQAQLHYPDVRQELAAQSITTPSPHDIARAVITIRQRKLPDPAQIGNAGSFFKNPIVSAQQHTVLLARYPNLVSYPQTEGSYKLAAAWLIEQCGWKGRSLGTAGVYEKQALVLINRGQATGQAILQLAQRIQADVQARFDVLLEPEAVFT